MKITPEYTTGKSRLKVTADAGKWLKVAGLELYAPYLYTSPVGSLADFDLEEVDAAACPFVDAGVWQMTKVADSTLDAAGVDPLEVADPGGVWKAGETVLKGWQRTYAGSAYRCLQTHMTQAGWIPPLTPALWAAGQQVVGIVTSWFQPINAETAYRQGDRVTHGGRTWEATVGNNTWEPGVYGWKEV